MLPFWDFVKKKNKKKTHALIEWKPQKCTPATQTNHCGLNKKGCYHFWHQQSNLPSLKLARGRHGLPATEEALHMPRRESSNVLSWWTMHCVCSQQIPYRYKAPICTHQGQSSSNRLGTRKMPPNHCDICLVPHKHQSLAQGNFDWLPPNPRHTQPDPWAQKHSWSKCAPAQWYPDWTLFIIGCPKIIVVTDHQPLTGIFGDRYLSKVHNLCFFRLKERCLISLHHPTLPRQVA